MAAYNAGDALRQAVAGIQSQTMTNWELLIVDDASVDGCTDFIGALHDGRIRLLRNDENMGAPLSRNRALEVARGAMIAVADADDVAAPIRLERQSDYLEQHPGVSLVAGATRVFGSGPRVGSVSTPLTTHEGLSLGLRLGPSFYHGSVMVRTEALRSIGGYRDVPPTEDYDMYARLLEAGHRFAALPEIVLHYREHPDGISKVRAATAEAIHREVSNRVRESVSFPGVGQLIRAARSEPAIRSGEPRLRFFKLLLRTSIELRSSRPRQGLKCAMAAVATGPATWRRSATSIRRLR